MISYVKMVLLAYLAIVNVVAFATMGIDKWKARKKKYRISEKTLFFLAFIGGSAGIFMGMYHFRHKIRNRKFILQIPIIFFVQLVVVIMAAQLTR